MRAIPSLTSRSGSDLFDIELVKVSGFDFAKQDVLDFAGAECRVGCHTVWSEIGSGVGPGGL